MAEILGIGMTHAPTLARPDGDGELALQRTLKTNDRIPPEMKNPTNWPEPMRIEYGEDEGLAAAKRMRERMVAGFRKLRAELDAFAPDFVVIWGDDQYENFKEDIIPPFCVYGLDDDFDIVGLLERLVDDGLEFVGIKRPGRYNQGLLGRRRQHAGHHDSAHQRQCNFLFHPISSLGLPPLRRHFRPKSHQMCQFPGGHKNVVES